MGLSISDQEFVEASDNRERMYEVELKRQPVDAGNTVERTFMDRLGRSKWPGEYVTARLRGYSHQDAMLVERIAIRQAAGIANPETAPAAPPPPPQPKPPAQPATPGSGTDTPGVQDNMMRFASFYKNRCSRTGFRPDENSTREGRIQFLQASILEFRTLFPLEKPFFMKRADPGRPISDEVCVWLEPGDDHRRFWDFLQSGGSPSWHVKQTAGELGHGEILPTSQPIVDPVTLNVMPG